jgi:hypothetical protein
MVTQEDAQKELRERIKKELATRLLEYFVPYVDPFSQNEEKAYIFKPFHKILTDSLERALER